MDTLKDLCGIVSVLNTPFSPENRLDLTSLTKNVRYAANAGVKGFLIPAMASEVYALQPDERSQLLQLVRKETSNLTLIGGASAPTHAESMAHAQDCIAQGCDGILVSIGQEDAKNLITRLQDIASLEPKFIMLQDWDAEGDGLEDKFVLDAFEKVDALKCVKIEVLNAGPKYSRLLEATQGAMHVSGGWAVTQMLDGLSRGVHAFMPTGMHATYVNIYNLFRSGLEDKAADIFERLSPILEFSNEDLDTSILFFKNLLHEQGLYATNRVRQPIDAWDEKELKAALPYIKAAIALEEECRSV